MSSLLKQVCKGKEVRPRRLMIYGVHGVGKSTFGSMAPRPIFIQTEDGLGDIECDKFPLARNYDDVLTALGELFSQEHDYQTVVIDSLDWLEQLIWAEVCCKHSVESIEQIGYQKGYVFALAHWREVLDGLVALRNDRGMMSILIAHSHIERVPCLETEPYSRYQPRLHKHASALVQEWCDDVLFATYKIHTVKVGESFNKTEYRGVGGDERIVHTTDRATHAAKNRLGLPDSFTLDWRIYEAFMRGDRDRAMAMIEPPSETADKTS